MKKLTLLIITFLLPSISFSLPLNMDTYYKLEIYSYDITNQNWTFSNLIRYYRQDDQIQSIIQYYVGGKTPMEVYKENFMYNDARKLIGYNTQDVDLNTMGWYVSRHDDYSYDLKGRLTKETVTPYDANISETDYGYPDNSDSVEYMLNLEWNIAKNDWDTLKLTFYLRDGNGLPTCDSILTYSDETHEFGNSERNHYYFDENKNLVKIENYKVKSGINNLSFLMEYSYNTNNKLLRFTTTKIENNQEYLTNITSYSYYESGSMKGQTDTIFISGNYNSHDVNEFDYQKHGDTTILTHIDSYYNKEKLNDKYKIIAYMFDRTESVTDQSESENFICFAPNPAPAYSPVNIYLGNGLSGNIQLQVFDPNGRVISKYFTRSINGMVTISAPGAPEGVYFIRAVSGNKIIGIGKIVITK